MAVIGLDPDEINSINATARRFGIKIQNRGVMWQQLMAVARDETRGTGERARARNAANTLRRKNSP